MAEAGPREPEQLALPFVPPAPPAPSAAARSWDENRVASLREAIARHAGEPIALEIHDNRSIMVSWRRGQEGVELRLHHMFLDGGEPVARALADFTSARRARRTAGRLLDEYIREHRGRIRPSRGGRPLVARGRVHDLAAIFQAVNDRYFGGAIDARIGWARAPLSRRRRTIKMGVYTHETRTIRIHPALDRPEVPPYVVAFVVFHEMLHQAYPPEKGPTGANRVHTRSFREREREHPDWERALAWEKEHLRLLLARHRA